MKKAVTLDDRARFLLNPTLQGTAARPDIRSGHGFSKACRCRDLHHIACLIICTACKPCIIDFHESISCDFLGSPQYNYMLRSCKDFQKMV